MKKLFVTILAFLYLGTTVGATVHQHFCMDKLASWALWQVKKHQSKRCSTCGMQKNTKANNGCCKDEYKQVKLQSDHKASANVLLQLSSIATTPVRFEVPPFELFSTTEEYPISNSPPRYGVIATYIRNCIFLI